MTTESDDVENLEAQVQALQKALCFWLPADDGTQREDVIERIHFDAQLLRGYDGDQECDALSLRWIAFCGPSP